jgi:hypothetical protein
MMMLRFEEWLIDQQERDDLIGDLARVPSMQDVQHKSSRRKPDEHRNWADIVIGMAETGYIAVFNEAWQEFLLAKQVAKDSLD